MPEAFETISLISGAVLGTVKTAKHILPITLRLRRLSLRSLAVLLVRAHRRRWVNWRRTLDR